MGGAHIKYASELSTSLRQTKWFENSGQEGLKFIHHFLAVFTAVLQLWADEAINPYHQYLDTHDYYHSMPHTLPPYSTGLHTIIAHAHGHMADNTIIYKIFYITNSRKIRTLLCFCTYMTRFLIHLN